jgi:GntR family transcriptional regulator
MVHCKSSGIELRMPASVRTGLPLYVKHATALRDAILEGEWVAGEQLPSEGSLATEWGVSQVTVRQALALLEEEGLVLRQQGRGTFVDGSTQRARALRLAIPVDNAEGAELPVRLVDVSRVNRPTDVVQALGLPPQSEVLRVVRVRASAGHPVSLAVSYIPDWLGIQFEPSAFRSPRLFDELESRGARFSAASQYVEARAAHGDTATHLDVLPGTPILQVRREYRLEDGRTGYVVLNRYPSPPYQLSLNLVRSDAQGSAPKSWSIRPEDDDT